LRLGFERSVVHAEAFDRCEDRVADLVQRNRFGSAQY